MGQRSEVIRLRGASARQGAQDLASRIPHPASSAFIRNLGFLHEDRLTALYNLCDVLAFPSLYEGFGMPVAEAQACGLPCVISNASSLPEIGGEGALYHDPLDAQALADQLQRVYEDKELRASLRAKGFANAQRFDWDRHVDTLMQYWGSILQPLTLEEPRGSPGVETCWM